MNAVSLEEATLDDMDTIIHYLHLMNDEIYQDEFEEDVTRQAVMPALEEDSDAHWFLFRTEDSKTFGTCYIAPLYNYWPIKKR